jgi:hypothetical protein
MTLSSLLPQVVNGSSPQIPALRLYQALANPLKPKTSSFKHHQPPQVFASCTQDEGHLRVPRTKIRLPPLTRCTHTSLTSSVPLLSPAASELRFYRSSTHPSNLPCRVSDLLPYTQLPCVLYRPPPTPAAPVCTSKRLVLTVSYITC